MRRFLTVLFVISLAVNVVLVGKESGLLAEVRSSYPLLSPRIFAEDRNDIIINFTDLRKELRAYVPAQGNIHAGVYFEYLPSGVSIGINEKDEFISASLIKVPFIMSIFRLLEKGTLALNTVLTLEKDDLDPGFGTLWKRGAGAQLTVEEAIEHTLKESDNTASIVLDAHAPTDGIVDVYNALDIPVDWSASRPAVSAKNYSSILRCLYLSCFLRYESSQRILELLTQTIFHDGLPAGVPADVPVAHKIGMYDSPDSTKRVRLDCGIVYVPMRPYILCILGETVKGQEQLVIDFSREVSNQVYRFVATRSSNP